MRMTNVIRESITKKMIEHRFKAEAEILLRKWRTFAMEVYFDIFDEETRMLMKSLPEGFLPKDTTIRVGFGTDSIDLDFGGGKIDKFKLETKVTELLSFNAHETWQPVKIYDSNHTLTNKYTDLVRATETLQEKIDESKSVIKATLYKIGTTESLLEKWPESAPFVELQFAPTKNLPALPIAHLNTLLDLPV